MSRFGFTDKGFLQHSEWSSDSEHDTSGRRLDSENVFYIFISHNVKSHYNTCTHVREQTHTQKQLQITTAIKLTLNALINHY
jgi:hypothetical protein